MNIEKYKGMIALVGLVLVECMALAKGVNGNGLAITLFILGVMVSPSVDSIRSLISKILK